MVSRFQYAGCVPASMHVPAHDILLDLRVESGILWGAITPKWRNRQTRTTQNRVPYGNEGSIPSFGIRWRTLALYSYE